MNNSEFYAAVASLMPALFIAYGLEIRYLISISAYIKFTLLALMVNTSLGFFFMIRALWASLSTTATDAITRNDVLTDVKASVFFLLIMLAGGFILQMVDKSIQVKKQPLLDELSTKQSDLKMETIRVQTELLFEIRDHLIELNTKRKKAPQDG